jgi:methylmalonyl-CoA mutase N-terminal domain/subunit
MSSSKETKEALERWQNSTLKKTLEKAPERNTRFSTVSDMEINRLYTPEDVDGLDYVEDIGFPGEFPFTRGVQSTGYRGKVWTMRQFAGFGSAEDTNQRFHYLLKQGQTGLSVAFHTPTLMGRDSDDPRSMGEIGKCGVAIDSLRDMEILFDGIPLDKVTTSMTTNAPAAIIWSMYLAVAEKQGASWDKLGGTIQNDILKEYIAQKTWIFPPRPSMRIITDIIDFATQNVPKWNTVSISGYHIREAGSTAVQELAFTIADGIAYVQACVDAGQNVDDFAPRLSFFWNSHNDFFEEIAKMRAARRMWARIMRDRFGAKDPRSWMCRFHTQTAGCSLTAQQPMNNVIRVAIQALAGVLGGTNSLHTNSLDETLALPTEQAVTIALRTQQIIAEESGVTNTVDPLGGSYFVEALTSKMEREAFEYIRKIDEMGGMIGAIENGFPQKEIAEAAMLYQRQIDAEDKIIVGVNRYKSESENLIPILQVSDELEKQKKQALAELRATRDNAKVEQALKALKAGAQGTDNLLPLILDAVRAYATLGEMCNTLREVFGEYVDPAYI